MDPLSHVAAAIAAWQTSGTLPEQERVATWIRDEPARQHMLAQPAFADALAQRAAGLSRLSCDELQNDLAGLVDMEMRGRVVPGRYDRLTIHLHQCPACYEEYRLVSDIVRAQQQGKLPRWPGEQDE